MGISSVSDDPFSVERVVSLRPTGVVVFAAMEQPPRMPSSRDAWSYLDYGIKQELARLPVQLLAKARRGVCWLLGR
ncbi:MAG: hypothetical protein ACRD6W_00365 [Nitrososphaerales archaeon]